MCERREVRRGRGCGVGERRRCESGERRGRASEGGARRDEAGESEGGTWGGISSERLSKISGLFLGGRAERTRPSRSAGLTAVVKVFSHLTRIRKAGGSVSFTWQANV